jgi:HK97 family phage portal protein
VIVRTRGGGRQELRALPGASDYIPRWSEYQSWTTHTGHPMTVERAAGVPAALNAILLIAETIGGLPLRVYTGYDADKTTAFRSWQWKLLHEEPNQEQSPFDFWQDVASCIESRGNAYAYKAKSGGQVAALYLFDPKAVSVKRDQRSGEKLFVVRGADGYVELTSSEVLHIRGPVIGTGDVGLTPIQVARNAMESAAASYRHEGDIYRNDATPPTVIEHPNNMTRDQAREFMQVWRMSHSGANRGAPGLLTQGATLKTYGLTMQDAQFIQSREFSVKDIARAYRLPPSALGAQEQGDIEQETNKLLSFGVNMRLRRIERAIKADRDLFPAGASEYPEFFTEELIRLDALTKAQVRHLGIQDGSLLPDEARAEIGRPPLPDGAGQIPQITPVGGAPNAVAGAATGAVNGNGNAAS